MYLKAWNTISKPTIISLYLNQKILDFCCIFGNQKWTLKMSTDKSCTCVGCPLSSTFTYHGNNIFISEGFNTNISHQFFDYKITFVNLQITLL